MKKLLLILLLFPCFVFAASITQLGATTGTGSAVLATSPTLAIPILGAATATSVTFSPTTGGIVGTTTNNNAGAGKVGEYVSSTVLMGSAVSATNNTPVNVTSISLTAGDWEVYGNICTTPGVTTTTTGSMGWISTLSATLPTYPNSGALARVQGITAATGFEIFLPVGTTRLSLSGTTTVYLTAYETFNTSTMAVYGFIGAIRAR